jgi:hypothetical protein
MRKNGVSKQTRRISACGILSALGVICLSVGSLIEVMDLSMIMIASFLIAFAVIEMGKRWAWLIWGVTALLSLLLLPNKLAALLYLMGGMYPIVKSTLERLRPLLSWAGKLVAFNGVQILFLMIARELFGMTGLDFSLSWGVLLFNNVLFILFDIVLTVFITFYLVKLRRRLKIQSLKD